MFIPFSSIVKKRAFRVEKFDFLLADKTGRQTKITNFFFLYTLSFCVYLD